MFRVACSGFRVSGLMFRVNFGGLRLEVWGIQILHASCQQEDFEASRKRVFYTAHYRGLYN